MANRTETGKETSGALSGLAWFSEDRFWGLVLVLAVVVAYLPVWHAGYIWDDDLMLTANGCVVGPFGLKEIWTTEAADICPLTLTTLWLEHKFWALNPLPYHLVNVLLHAAGAVLLWRVLRELRIPGAWFGAALWALHPVQVESAAWIAEMKNTESAVFYLLSILFFLKWLGPEAGGDPKKVNRNYAFTLLFAALAMASKTSTVILPIMLCLCAWWMEGRWQWRTVLRVWPVWLMSVAGGALSLWTQNRRGTGNVEWVQAWPEHLATAGSAIWFYLGKLIWPHPLLMIYPPSEINPSPPFTYLPLLGAAIVLGVTWYYRQSWARPWFFTFAYFLVALFPVLGLANNGAFVYSPVFDHFQYLASMAPLALAAAGMVRLADFAMPGNSPGRTVLGAGVLLILGAISCQHAGIFKDEQTLWTYMLKEDPKCWAAYTNLGIDLAKKGRVDEAVNYFQKGLELNPRDSRTQNDLGLLLAQKGQLDEAESHFQKALAIDPHYAHAEHNLGNLLARKGQVDEAIGYYQKAIVDSPNDPQIHVSLGVSLAQKGQVDEAMSHFKRALAIDPNYPEAHYNLGNSYLQMGEMDEAIEHFQTALKLNPDNFRIHNNLARVLAQKGRLDEAIVEFRAAVEFEPKNAALYQNLGRVLAQSGQMDDAILQFQKSLEVDPGNLKIRYLLGNAFMQTGQVNEAVAQYRKILESDPANTAIHNGLGFALARIGKLDEAVAEFQKSLAINPNDPAAINNLGIIFAQKGELDKAVAQFQKALQIKPGFADAQKNLAQAQALIKQKSEAGRKAQPKN